MKIAIFGDIHFNGFKPFANFDQGTNSRFLEILDAFVWACRDAKKKGCEYTMVPGDIFHTRGALRPSIFNPVFRQLQSEAERMGFLFIPGNHDMENYRGGETAVDCFEGIPNVAVATEPFFMPVPGTKLIVACIPYIHNHDEFKDQFKAMLEEQTPDAFLIHQGIDNFANPGMPDLGLTVEWIREHYDGPIFSGHYHKPMLNDGVLSPGSLVQHGFGDSGEHGYWIWDSEEGTIDFVPVPGPEFVTVTSQAAAKKTKGQYVRVAAQDIKSAEKIRTAAEKAGAKGVMLKLEKSFTTAHDETIALSGPKEMLTEYIKLKHNDRAAALVKLFEKICEGGAAT